MPVARVERSRIRRVSTRQGYARRPSESMYPELWNGLEAAYLPGVQPGSNTLYDFSGNYRHGTLQSMVYGQDFVHHLGRGSVEFDGTNDTISLPTTIWAGTEVGISLAFWAKCTVNTAGDRRAIEISNNAPSVRASFGTVLTMVIPANTEISVATPAGVNVTQWHHYVFTAVAGNGNPLTLYVDGAVAATGSATGAFGLFGGTQASNIGSVRGGTLGNFFPGWVGDVYVYNRVITLREIGILAGVDSALVVPKRKKILFDPSIIIIPSSSPPPTNFQATTGSELGEIVLTWNAVPGAIAYHLFRADTEDGVYEFIGQSTALTRLDDELESSTTYWYKIASEDEVGVGPLSAAISGTTIVILSAPTNFSASTGTYFGQISLTWDAVVGAAFYRIYRSIDDNLNMTFLATSGSASYADTGLLGPRTYFYAVSAVDNSSVEGPFSNQDSATTLGAGEAAPPPPQDLVATSGPQAGQATLTWTSSGLDVFVWHVYRSTTSGSGFAKIAEIGPASGNITSGTYVDSGLSISLTYYYRVTADNFLESAPSQEATLEPAAVFPAAPVNIVAVTGLFEGYITVTWTAVIGATGYNVYRSLESDGPYVLVAPTTLPRFFDSGLEHNTTYYYRVAAVQA